MAAATVVPMFWEQGTIFATAMTPVIVALVSEGAAQAGPDRERGRAARGAAHRAPAPPCAASSPRRPSTRDPERVGARGEGPERFEPLPPAPARRRAAHARRRPVRPAQGRSGTPRPRLKIALVTGLLAFVIAAGVVTASELALFGGSVSSDRRTSLFGGQKLVERRRAPTADADARPATPGRGGHADARRRRRPTPEPTATPTPTATPAPRRRRRPRPRRPRAGRPSALPSFARMAKDRIPTSRLARTAKVSSLAAGQAARQLGTRAANVARTEEGRDKALERRHLEAAEQIVAALGTMKGAAMKLGQVMSFLDVGLVPEEHREEFQRKLGQLRDAAPKVRFSDMRKVIESELDEPLEETFAAFEHQPIAAASIGQVYRARLHDGRDVAVKVQYPGVAQAVRADMQNLGMILRLMKRIAPGLDVKATAEEIRGADRRRARLRARGPEPAHDGAHLPRPPVHRRARRGLARSRARR